MAHFELADRYFRLLSRVATLYYLEERTQREVADELNLSRQKVQRMLKQARELGIVEIHVHSIPMLHREQEEQLKTIFGLDDVIVAPSQPTQSRTRHSVAMAAADYLERNLSHSFTVAIGFGRNTSEVANALRSNREVFCTFVSAMGGSPQFAESINPNNTCNLLASRVRGTSRALYAPAYVENKRARDMLIKEPSVRESLELAKKADVALVGIGTPGNDSILVQANIISAKEAKQLRAANAVGEVLGNFFDEEGREVGSELSDRRIALTLEDLRNIPRVIAVASEKAKTRAIYGALRSGVLNALIVDCDNAVEILRLSNALQSYETQRIDT